MRSVILSQWYATCVCVCVCVYVICEVSVGQGLCVGLYSISHSNSGRDFQYVIYCQNRKLRWCRIVQRYTPPLCRFCTTYKNCKICKQVMHTEVEFEHTYPTYSVTTEHVLSLVGLYP